MTERLHRQDIETFFRETEIAAKKLPLRAVPVPTENGPSGLILIKNNTDAETIRNTAASLMALTGIDTPMAATEPPLAPAPSLHQIIEIEIERVRQTRLPCALLVLETSNTDEFHITPQIIEEHLLITDVIADVSPGRVAFILPGTGLGRAVSRAGRILDELRNHKPFTPFIGAAACYPDDTNSAVDFLNRAETELKKAIRKKTPCVCHDSGSRLENSCQVTVEERTQLFQCFGGSENP